MLDQPGVGVALWGARRPNQLDALPGALDFSIDTQTQDDINRIISEEIKNPVGPEFMAPPAETIAT